MYIVSGSLGWLTHLWIMAAPLSTGIVGISGQRTEAGPCWDRTVHPDDVLVVCRLEVDVSKTRHGIALVPTNKETKRLLVCGWNGNRCPKCYSDYTVHPLGDVTDVLVVGVPAEEWQKDISYKYQLVPPPDRPDPYLPCEVIVTKIAPQLKTPVTQETADEATVPNVTQETTVEAITLTARTYVSECGDDQDRGNSCEVFSLLVVAIVLLAVILASIIVISFFAYLQLMRKKAVGDAVSNPLLEKPSKTSLDSGLSDEVV